MSKNPNAVAALVSSQAAVALEQLGQDYLDVHVGSFWSKEIIAGAVAVILYIGRDGIKAALVQTLHILKSAWSPAKPAAKN